MSSELKSFLHEKGIATSQIRSYNPAGNGLVEKMNGTIWKAVTMALKSRQLPTKAWQEILGDALNSIRSLLCTSINCTPHKLLFTYQRKSTSSTSVPSWMATPGPVLLKRFTRSFKYDPLVEEVELLEANPRYADVWFLNGSEDTLANKHLAPLRNNMEEPQTVTKQSHDQASVSFAHEPEQIRLLVLQTNKLTFQQILKLRLSSLFYGGLNEHVVNLIDLLILK